MVIRKDDFLLWGVHIKKRKKEKKKKRTSTNNCVENKHQIPNPARLVKTSIQDSC